MYCLTQFKRQPKKDKPARQRIQNVLKCAKYKEVENIQEGLLKKADKEATTLMDKLKSMVWQKTFSHEPGLPCSRGHAHTCTHVQTDIATL